MQAVVAVTWCAAHRNPWSPATMTEWSSSSWTSFIPCPPEVSTLCKAGPPLPSVRIEFISFFFFLHKCLLIVLEKNQDPILKLAYIFVVKNTRVVRGWGGGNVAALVQMYTEGQVTLSCGSSKVPRTLVVFQCLGKMTGSIKHPLNVKFVLLYGFCGLTLFSNSYPLENFHSEWKSN